MASTISYTVDDKDLDDAALWAVIDSAAASHSISSVKSPKPLAIKYPNFDSPPTPVTHPSQPLKLPQNLYPNPGPSRHRRSQQDSWRPPKIVRSRAAAAPEMSERSRPLALVPAAQRTPTSKISTMTFPSSESYLSPEIGKLSNGLDVSPSSEIVDEMRHSLSGRFPSVSLFKEYQNAAMAILEKSDYTMISGNPFIKKSGWRKISFYFNVSYEIKDKTIEFDENSDVQRAEFVVRASMRGGRFCDGWGSCGRREKRFLKPNHDIPSTAETRAKNRACQDLLGIGEYRPGANQFQR